MAVCENVCVKDRQTEADRQTNRQTDRQRERYIWSRIF